MEPEPKPRKAPEHREWRAQEVDWVFLMRALPHGAMAYGIDQSAKRTKAANMRRLARGCRPGVPDTYIFWSGILLWLERKREGGGKLSRAQEIFRDDTRANGGHWALIETTDEVEAACLAAGIPLRATLGGIRGRIADQQARLPAKKRKTARKAKAEPRKTGGKGFVRRTRVRGIFPV